MSQVVNAQNSPSGILDFVEHSAEAGVQLDQCFFVDTPPSKK
jgi:hypothetical protein